eukprot:403367390
MSSTNFLRNNLSEQSLHQNQQYIQQFQNKLSKKQHLLIHSSISSHNHGIAPFLENKKGQLNVQKQFQQTSTNFMSKRNNQQLTSSQSHPDKIYLKPQANSQRRYQHQQKSEKQINHNQARDNSTYVPLSQYNQNRHTIHYDLDNYLNSKQNDPSKKTFRKANYQSIQQSSIDKINKLFYKTAQISNNSLLIKNQSNQKDEIPFVKDNGMLIFGNLELQSDQNKLFSKTSKLKVNDKYEILRVFDSDEEDKPRIQLIGNHERDQLIELQTISNASPKTRDNRNPFRVPLSFAESGSNFNQDFNRPESSIIHKNKIKFQIGTPKSTQGSQHSVMQPIQKSQFLRREFLNGFRNTSQLEAKPYFQVRKSSDKSRNELNNQKLQSLHKQSINQQYLRDQIIIDQYKVLSANDSEKYLLNHKIKQIETKLKLKRSSFSKQVKSNKIKNLKNSQNLEKLVEFQPPPRSQQSSPNKYKSSKIPEPIYEISKFDRLPGLTVCQSRESCKRQSPQLSLKALTVELQSPFIEQCTMENLPEEFKIIVQNQGVVDDDGFEVSINIGTDNQNNSLRRSLTTKPSHENENFLYNNKSRTNQDTKIIERGKLKKRLLSQEVDKVLENDEDCSLTNKSYLSIDREVYNQSSRRIKSTAKSELNLLKALTSPIFADENRINQLIRDALKNHSKIQYNSNGKLTIKGGNELKNFIEKNKNVKLQINKKSVMRLRKLLNQEKGLWIDC